MTDATPYRSRRSAGQFLAKHLAELRGREGLVVLALPRGGVPVGYEVALALEVPLDVFVVQPVVALNAEGSSLGAVATGDVSLWDEASLATTTLTRAELDEALADARSRLAARERTLRGDRAPVDVRGKHVVVVDDGFLTGGTMRLALAGLAPQSPASVTVAAPVGAPETCADLRSRATAVICPRTPDPFYAVGLWYEQFAPVADDEACHLLDAASHTLASRTSANNPSAGPYGDATRA